MALYFFHLADGADVNLDPDGIELGPEDIAATTLCQARDCMAGDVKRGWLDLNYRIDVHAENGLVVHSLAFRDAVEMAAPR